MPDIYRYKKTKLISKMDGDMVGEMIISCSVSKLWVRV